MKVLKFGGSSVGAPEGINRVLDIVSDSLRENKKVAVVVSAFQGVTDQLIRMATLASRGDQRYLDSFRELEARHLAAVTKLISAGSSKPALAAVKKSLAELKEVLHGVFLVRELTARTLDFIMSFGERLSAYIISRTFHDRNTKAEYLDARQVLKTDQNFGAARVNIPETYANIRAYFRKRPEMQIMTGFIGATSQDETTTLGRGGSDYSASLLGAALEVDEIEIWTDVDGVLTADPRVVKEAFPIESMTYEEAMELSHFGAKVIHPPTMQPVLKLNIPIRIKNTFHPKFPGTLISSHRSDDNHVICGLSSISHVVLLRLQGSGMVGIPGIASRLFGALARKQISVILITQASSEHSICLAVEPKAAEVAGSVIEEEFSLEMQVERIDPVVLESDRAILAAVGENMRNTPGIAGRLFAALGRSRVNVIAIAQGSSELNVSIVVDQKDEVKGLNAIHNTFFANGKKTLNVFLVGTGLIGGTLLKQMEDQMDTLGQDHSLNLHLAAVANSRRMLFDPPFPLWKRALDTKGEASNLQEFVQRMKDARLACSVFVDCTAGDSVAFLYSEILRSGIAVVTPNKRANSGDFHVYADLKESARKSGVPFLYEANVGAGLPVIGTLNDLIKGGDKIVRIEAVLSGTLSYIFSSLSAGTSFSEAVRQAREKGYTEPDPAEDLNGMDVARKLLILARETGLELEPRDIALEPLLPPALHRPRPVDEFMTQIKGVDAVFEKRRARAAKAGKKLQYIAMLEGDSARVALSEVGPDHPFFSLSGSDNIVAFTTKRYRRSPLVVRGPGAGAEVTAAAVFADILRAAQWQP